MEKSDLVIEETRLDLLTAVDALRRAIQREDSEFGSDGLGNRLSLTLDELLALV